MGPSSSILDDKGTIPNNIRMVSKFGITDPFMILSDCDSFSLSLCGFEDGFVSTMHIFDVCTKF